MTSGRAEQPDRTRSLGEDQRATSGRRCALVVVHRDGAEIAPIEEGKSLVVGRVAPADVVVPDDSLSRQHARFLLRGDEIIVEDLGSTNGTFIGGRAVEADVVRFGDPVMLGAVTTMVQMTEGSSYLGLDGHDRFSLAVDRELARGRYFGRPMALILLRSSPGESAPLHAWAPRIAAAVRDIDSVALFGGTTVEVLLPECDAKEGAERAKALVGHIDGVSLRCGVSAFPALATSTEQLVASCLDALRATSAAEPVAVAPTAGVSSGRPDGDATAPMVAKSAAMDEVVTFADKVARGSLPVFIHGETGTGKEVLARYIHATGPRSGAPIVAVNCAAIPLSLVESTLFGHEKGAFSGATATSLGVFEAADGGTVLLDEIGELEPRIQAAILRVLESKTITRVGSTKERDVDVRILAASHRNLEVMVENKEFREDLLYRLNAMTIEIPPLRARREDIPHLCHRFLKQANERNGMNVSAIDEQAMRALERYDWPGNIRELRNVIERAVVIADDDMVGLRDLPGKIRGGVAQVPPPVRARTSIVAAEAQGDDVRLPGETFRACIERVEIGMLVAALAETNGNQTQASKLLDLSRRTLVHKIGVYGLRDRDE